MRLVTVTKAVCSSSARLGKAWAALWQENTGRHGSRPVNSFTGRGSSGNGTAARGVSGAPRGRAGSGEPSLRLRERLRYARQPWAFWPRTWRRLHRDTRPTTVCRCGHLRYAHQNGRSCSYCGRDCPRFRLPPWYQIRAVDVKETR
jgi:hypothetical protein